LALRTLPHGLGFLSLHLNFRLRIGLSILLVLLLVILRDLVLLVFILIILKLQSLLRDYISAASNHSTVPLIINHLFLIVSIEEDVDLLKLLDHLSLYSSIHLKACEELINLIAMDAPRLVEHDKVLALGTVIDENEVLLIIHLYLLQLFEGIHLNPRKRLIFNFL